MSRVPSKEKKAKPLPEKLLETEEQIVKLLGRRSRLLSEMAKQRKGRRKSLVDSEQEKKLWEIWRNRAEFVGYDEKTLRRIFYLLNDLGYERNESSRDREFKLRPFTSPAAVDLPGPPDRVLSRMWMAVASASGQELEVSGVWNDPLFELLRALNSAGAELSREGEKVRAFAGKGLEFDQKSIFAGNDPFNLYLLVFLAATGPVRCKFTGESGLKQTDLQPLFAMLPSLGARGVSLMPGSSGLPMRLEASGVLSDTLTLPGDAPPEMLGALLAALTACDMRRAVRVQWKEGRAGQHYAERARHICEQSGIEARFGELEAELAPAAPEAPREPAVELDPYLCAYVLALPGLVGGRTRLQGIWPGWMGEAGDVLGLLGEAGLELRAGQGSVETVPAGPNEAPCTFDLRGSPELLPAATALALARPGSSVRFAGESESEYLREVLEKLRVAYDMDGEDRVLVQNGPQDPFDDIRLRAPDPWWTLGTALVSTVRRNIALENPGELASLWPQFWSLFKGLPEPQNRMFSAKNEDTGQEGNEPRKRRRIVE